MKALAPSCLLGPISWKFRLCVVLCFNPLSPNDNNNNDLEVAHPQSGSLSTWFLIELEFENVGFWGEGKAEVPGEKPLGARERTNNKLNPHMAFTPRFEPGPLWWEVNALTTVSSLAPCNNSDQQPISPNNNTAWLNIPFMRMKEMIITNDGTSWCLNKLSQLVP